MKEKYQEYLLYILHTQGERSKRYPPAGFAGKRRMGNRPSILYTFMGQFGEETGVSRRLDCRRFLKVFGRSLDKCGNNHHPFKILDKSSEPSSIIVRSAENVTSNT